jgi:hypothetical protein
MAVEDQDQDHEQGHDRDQGTGFLLLIVTIRHSTQKIASLGG